MIKKINFLTVFYNFHKSSVKTFLKIPVNMTYKL